MKDGSKCPQCGSCNTYHHVGMFTSRFECLDCKYAKWG